MKNTGLGKSPFFDFAANQAWANIVALAFNLVSWLQLAALPDGHHAKAWDIKRWRYRLFTTPGKIITRARRNQLLLPESAPEKDLLTLLLENTARLNKRTRSFHRLIVALILSQRTARSPEVEPAPTQANQQAAPDCPKTENNSPSAAATNQRQSTSVMKNRG